MDVRSVFLYQAAAEVELFSWKPHPPTLLETVEPQDRQCGAQDGVGAPLPLGLHTKMRTSFGEGDLDLSAPNKKAMIWLGSRSVLALMNACGSRRPVGSQTSTQRICLGGGEMVLSPICPPSAPMAQI